MTLLFGPKSILNVRALRFRLKVFWAYMPLVWQKRWGWVILQIHTLRKGVHSIILKKNLEKILRRNYYYYSVKI